MITISPEYVAHFLEVYVKKTEGAKFTCDRSDRIRFLVLSLPLAVRDLIAPEVYLTDIDRILVMIMQYSGNMFVILSHNFG